MCLSAVPLCRRVTASCHRDRLSRGAAALVDAAQSHPFSVLFAWLLAALAALMAARTLTLDTDLVHLLPADAPSVAALDDLQARTGGEGTLVVLGEGGNARTLARFAAAAVARLSRHAILGPVETATPVTWFADRAGYFLTLTELTAIRDRIAARVVWERALADEPVGNAHVAGPSLEFDDISAQLTGARAWLRAQLRGQGHYLDARNRRVAVVAYPRGRASDLDFARRVVAVAEAALADLNPSDYGADFRFALGGRYANSVRLAARLSADIRMATATAAVVLTLLLALAFGVRGLVLVGVPLILALVVTYGLAVPLFGRVNILTALLGAILGGLGLDHGIHLMARAQRATAADPRHAWHEAVVGGAHAVLAAAVTTAAAGVALATSEFRAFREFGTLAALGMAVVLLAYTTAAPALSRLVGLPRRRADADPAAAMVRWLVQRRRWCLAVLLPLLLAAAWSAARIDFAVDFAAVERFDPEQVRRDAVIADLLGASSSPVAVLTATPAAARRIAAELRADQAARGADSTIDFVVSGADLVPAGQAAKQVLLADIDDWLQRLGPRLLPRAEARAWEQLVRAARAAPFTVTDVPAVLWRRLGGSDRGNVVLVFPRIDPSNGRDVLRLAHELRATPSIAAGAGVVAGETIVLADVLDLLLREGPPLAAATLVAITCLLWLFLRRAASMAIVFGGAAITILGMLGALAALGLSLDYLNVVLLPIIFGLAVDAGIHAVAPGGHSDVRHRAQVLRAVAVALVTTAGSFAALVTAAHPGVRHLGAAALLGLGANALAMLLWIAPLAWRPYGRAAV